VESKLIKTKRHCRCQRGVEDAIGLVDSAHFKSLLAMRYNVGYKYFRNIHYNISNNVRKQNVMNIGIKQLILETECSWGLTSHNFSEDSRVINVLDHGENSIEK